MKLPPYSVAALGGVVAALALSFAFFGGIKRGDPRVPTASKTPSETTAPAPPPVETAAPAPPRPWRPLRLRLRPWRPLRLRLRPWRPLRPHPPPVETAAPAPPPVETAAPAPAPAKPLPVRQLCASATAACGEAGVRHNNPAAHEAGTAGPGPGALAVHATSPTEPVIAFLGATLEQAYTSPAAGSWPRHRGSPLRGQFDRVHAHARGVRAHCQRGRGGQATPRREPGRGGAGRDARSRTRSRWSPRASWAKAAPGEPIDKAALPSASAPAMEAPGAVAPVTAPIKAPEGRRKGWRGVPPWAFPLASAVVILGPFAMWLIVKDLPPRHPQDGPAVATSAQPTGINRQR